MYYKDNWPHTGDMEQRMRTEQFPSVYTCSCSCILLVDCVLVDLWPEQTVHFLWHMNTSPSEDFDLQYISPHPQSHPRQAKPKLFTLSKASCKWESAKCAELFSCPTVNREQHEGKLRRRKWIRVTENPDLSWMTGFVPEGHFKPFRHLDVVFSSYEYDTILQIFTGTVSTKHFCFPY